MKEEFNLELISEPKGPYDAIILAVAHKKFEELDIWSLKKADGIIYDVKSVLSKEIIDGRL